MTVVIAPWIGILLSGCCPDAALVCPLSLSFTGAPSGQVVITISLSDRSQDVVCTINTSETGGDDSTGTDVDSGTGQACSYGSLTGSSGVLTWVGASSSTTGHVTLSVDGTPLLDADVTPVYGPSGHPDGPFCPASCNSGGESFAISDT